MWLAAIAGVLLVVGFIRYFLVTAKKVDVLIEGVFQERKEGNLFMSDKKAWFCCFEKYCVECREKLGRADKSEKLRLWSMRRCSEMVPLKARLVGELPKQWDAVRLIVGRTIFGKVVSYEFGRSYDPEMVEKSRGLQARLADTGVDAETGKPKLYDLAKEDYPLKKGIEFRTSHAATCMVCGAYTNKAVVADPFGYSCGSRDVLSFRCPHTNEEWHRECAIMDADGSSIFSESWRLKESSDPDERKRAEELDAELKEIEDRRRALFDAHRLEIRNDIVGDSIPAKYYKDAY